jgi:UDP-glucuronate 4-epimerase
MYRDFTYIDDLVRAICLLVDVPPPSPSARTAEHGWQPIPGDTLSAVAPWRVVNIGNSQPVRLLDFVDALEKALGKKAIRRYLPMQKGDVPATWADCSLLARLTGYTPQTPVAEGVARFVAWYRDYTGR